MIRRRHASNKITREDLRIELVDTQVDAARAHDAQKDPAEFPVIWVGDFIEHQREHPNVMVLYEALPTNAPQEAQPYCCLRSTVLFYKMPYEVVCEGKHKGGYARWDEIETQWSLLGYRIFEREAGWYCLAPMVWCEDEWWLLASGQVVWRNERWEMKRTAYRNARECDWMRRFYGMSYAQVCEVVKRNGEGL